MQFLLSAPQRGSSERFLSLDGSWWEFNTNYHNTRRWSVLQFSWLGGKGPPLFSCGEYEEMRCLGDAYSSNNTIQGDSLHGLWKLAPLKVRWEIPKAGRSSFHGCLLCYIYHLVTCFRMWSFSVPILFLFYLWVSAKLRKNESCFNIQIHKNTALLKLEGENSLRSLW